MDNYQKKIENVAPEKVIDIPTIIGTPIIDRLTYITNEEIADLFLNLLTKASSSDTINEVHPAFIHIIDRLSVDEARIINHLSDRDFFPFINLISRKEPNVGVFQKVGWNLTGLEYEVELLSPQCIDTYLDNLSSQQIIQSQGKIYKTEETLYKNLEEKYKDVINEMNTARSNLREYKACEIEKGFFEITELGKSFIIACRK